MTENGASAFVSHVDRGSEGEGRWSPSLEPGGLPGQQSSERLRRELRAALSRGLSERLRADEAAARPAMSPAERRTVAQQLLAAAAERHTQGALTRGEVVVTPDVERAVIAAVLDEVFGLAGLEPLLRDPLVENINVNGDRVFVRYADGRREQLPPVVASDTELVQLIRDLAARSGVEERRFDCGSPGVGFQLPSGERAFAVMAVTARPSLSIDESALVTALKNGTIAAVGLDVYEREPHLTPGLGRLPQRSPVTASRQCHPHYPSRDGPRVRSERHRGCGGPTPAQRP